MRYTCGVRDCDGKLKMISELWDDIDKVVVVDQLCQRCGAVYLGSRKATREELAAGYAHHERITPKLKG